MQIGMCWLGFEFWKFNYYNIWQLICLINLNNKMLWEFSNNYCCYLIKWVGVTCTIESECFWDWAHGPQSSLLCKIGSQPLYFSYHVMIFILAELSCNDLIPCIISSPHELGPCHIIIKIKTPNFYGSCTKVKL